MPSPNGHPPVIRMTLHGGPDTGLTAPGVGAETWPWPPPAHSDARDPHTPDRAFQHHLRVTDHAATRLHTHTPTPRPHQNTFLHFLSSPPKIQKTKQKKHSSLRGSAPNQSCALAPERARPARAAPHTCKIGLQQPESHSVFPRHSVCVGGGASP